MGKGRCRRQGGGGGVVILASSTLSTDEIKVLNVCTAQCAAYIRSQAAQHRKRHTVDFPGLLIIFSTYLREDFVVTRTCYYCVPMMMMMAAGNSYAQQKHTQRPIYIVHVTQWLIFCKVATQYCYKMRAPVLRKCVEKEHTHI